MYFIALIYLLNVTVLINMWWYLLEMMHTYIGTDDWYYRGKKSVS